MPKRRVSPFPTVTLDPVGQCIYCGRSDRELSLEHIFPLALGGTYELPQASCARCASVINNQVENPISSQDWGWVREKVGLPTRGKTDRRWVPVGTTSGRKLKIPIADYPACSFSYNFGTARLLSGSKAEQKRDLLISTTDPEGKQDAACKVKYPDWDGVYSTRAKPQAFARLLAKVAWGWVVGFAGSNWFRESITPIILGATEDYTTHVGGDMDGYQWDGAREGMPGFYIRPESNSVAKVICDLRFINDDAAPHYHVVVGETDWHRTQDGTGFTFGTGTAGPQPPCISIKRNWDLSEGMRMGPVRMVVNPAAVKQASVLPGLPGGPGAFVIESTTRLNGDPR